MGKDFCDGVTLEHICIEAKEFGRFSEIKDWTWNDLSPDISGFCQDARRYLFFAFLANINLQKRMHHISHFIHLLI